MDFPGGSSGKEPTCQCRRHWFDPWVRKVPWRRDRLSTPVFLGFPCDSPDKQSPAMQETLVRFLSWEDLLEKGKSYPLQYSGLENYVDCVVQGVAKSQTQLSNFRFTSLHFTS